MLSLLVHYKNKYPGHKITMSESGLDVYSVEGEHKVALRKNGAGQMLDQSEQLGCADRHDLSPIPKESRLYKVVGHKVAQDDKYSERAQLVGKFVDESGKVQSCEELVSKGFSFEKDFSLKAEPKKA